MNRVFVFSCLAATLVLIPSGCRERVPIAEPTVDTRIVDEDPAVRKQAAIENLQKSPTTMGKIINIGILGVIGPDASDAVPEIEKYLTDPEEGVRRAARTAIKKITGEERSIETTE